MKESDTMKNYLKHLSDDQIDMLMQRYYDGENVANLVEEYDIQISSSHLYRCFPPMVCNDYICDYCHVPLVINRPSKSASKYAMYKKDLYCAICGHKPFQIQCTCINCRNKEEQLRKEQIEEIKKFYSQQTNRIAFSNLSFRNKVYLGALCRAGLKEDLYEIVPYVETNEHLTPTDHLSRALYASLIHTNAISVSPDSSLGAFDCKNEKFPNEYDVFKVTYYLNLLFPENKQSLFTEILNPNYYSHEYKEEALVLWKEIAIEECIAYLKYQLQKVNFEFNPGEKTYKIFEIILEDFSVSQIYGIIWKAVADAARLYLEKGISKKHAANSVIGACERYADRAKLNNWELTHYNRIRDLPESALSAFYFNRVLGIGEMGFKMPPTIL